MSSAYKCDKCKKFVDGTLDYSRIFQLANMRLSNNRNNALELCMECSSELKLLIVDWWKSNEPQTETPTE